MKLPPRLANWLRARRRLANVMLRMRASDADRDRVLDVLCTAAVEGRLTPAEFDERLGDALAARTLGELAALTADLVAGPGWLEVTAAARAEDVIRISQRGGLVTRGGRWLVPRRMVLRPSWCDVKLDFTNAVITHATLPIEVNMRGGSLILVAGPDIAVNSDSLAVRYTDVTVGSGARRDTPVQLRIELAGWMRYGWIEFRYPE
jgi:hypothetical protein